MDLLNEYQSENACHPQVVTEVVELALLHEVHEPLEGDDAEYEGDEHAYEKFRGETAGVSAFLRVLEAFCHIGRVLALEPLDTIEEGCATHGGDAHEETEFARVLAVHAEENHAANRRTATADARDAGDALHDTGNQGAPPVHLDAFVFRVLRAGFSPLGSEQQTARDEEGRAHGARICEQTFKSVLESKANHGGRDARENDVARFLQLRGVAFHATDDDVHNLLAEYHKDGKQRTCVKHDVKEHARFVHVQEFVPEHQMAGTGNGEEFCEALQQAEDNGFNHK